MALLNEIKIILKDVFDIYRGVINFILILVKYLGSYIKYSYYLLVSQLYIYKKTLLKNTHKTFRNSYILVRTTIKKARSEKTVSLNNYIKVLKSRCIKLNRFPTKLFKRRSKSLTLPKFKKSKKIDRTKKEVVKTFRFWFVFRAKLYILFLFLIFLIASYFYFNIIYSLPNPNNVVVGTKRLTSYVYDKNGDLLYKNYKDTNRTLVSINDLPPYLIEAILSVEDDNFYSHHGISLTGILRAGYKNFENKDVVQGGSTITQQLVKNTLLTPEKTLERKIKEAVMSVMVDYKYPKNEILEMYLNTVSFGGTSYGVQEASQMYFNKDAKDLTLAESALLAGLPTAPTDNSPYADLTQSKSRQEEVLVLMVKNEYITNTQARDALNQKLNIQYPVTQIKYPHFVFYIEDYIRNKYGEYLFDNGGLRVYTSLDPEKQNIAQNVVTDEVAKISSLRISNGSALITNNKTGEVVAMVGSKNFYAKDIDGFVNLTTSLRQPGSSIKPFNYSLGIKNGMTAGTIILDTPVSYATPGSPVYKPVNYDGKFRGPVTLRRALANSLNIPSVKVLEKNGVNNFIDYARLFGFKHWDRDYYGLSLALGAAEVTMVELNQGFSVFANKGNLVPVNPILYITNSGGDIIEYNPCVYTEEDFKDKKILFKPGECGTNIIPESNAFIIKSILSDFNARKEAFGVSILNVFGTGVKTGTTNDLRDNWAIGFNDEYTVGAWVGNNDNTPMSYVASGITGASPIWANIIKQVTNEQNYLDLDPPGQVYKANICPITGQLSCHSCGGFVEYYVEGSQPKQHCSEDYINSLKENRNEEEKDK
ncbi:hypothetical protein GW755_02165 [bacterium]|nr:hypothetical protein [bacterium]